MMTKERFQHYRLNHTILDEEHLMLFALMDKAVTELRSGAPLSDCTANDLMDRWMIHVVVENKLMTDSAYPYAKYHQIEHETRRQSIERLMSMAADHPALSNAIGEFEMGFIRHVDTYDRQLAEYLNSQK